MGRQKFENAWLIQAFSRTNRILNSIKTFGNIVCFRNLQRKTDEAISLFGDKNAKGIVLLKDFKDYYEGYLDDNGIYHKGYVDMINELNEKFPLEEPSIIGEKIQKEFINLFGLILRMRNLLSSFDDFSGKEIISERDFQDYCGRYLDLKEEWKNKQEQGEAVDISDDVVFEIELLKQIEINIDYILMLFQKYHDSHCKDKEILLNIVKAIDSSPEMRSKKVLIENFINTINNVDDVITEWHFYVALEKEKTIKEIIEEEDLKEEETRKFIATAFETGNVKTTGTDIDKILPPISRFGKNNRDEKRKSVLTRIFDFFERFFGIG